MRSGIITIISAHFANVRLRLLHRFSLSRSLSPRLPLDVRGSNCDRASFPFHCKMLPWNCQVSIILCMRAAIFMVHSSAPRTSFIASGLAKNFLYYFSSCLSCYQQSFTIATSPGTNSFPWHSRRKSRKYATKEDATTLQSHDNGFESKRNCSGEANKSLRSVLCRGVGFFFSLSSAMRKIGIFC